MRARIAIKLANIRCELREVRLNNKPDHMIEASPKGTVPVLILEDKIIDESMDIINWVLSKVDIFNGNLENDEIDLTEKLITIFDSKFKYHLDRYKYSNRYKNEDLELHRNECLKILFNLENVLSNEGWMLGDQINKLDISILPFIRQFRISDSDWFDSKKEISKVQKSLNNFLDSELFEAVMTSYDVWNLDSAPVYYP